MVTVTIPKSVSRIGELVVIPKKDLDALILRANEAVGVSDVLRWSKEARSLRRRGKLPVLRSSRSR